MKNEMELIISALSENEAFARNVIAAFCVGINPTIDEIDDVKTVVSEAVTNCIVHAYKNENGKIILRASILDHTLKIEVEDFGVGIENIDKAIEPFYTDKPDDERSGMGFTVMKAFTDEFSVENKETGGVIIKMTKKFRVSDKAVDDFGGTRRSIKSY